MGTAYARFPAVSEVRLFISKWCEASHADSQNGSQKRLEIEPRVQPQWRTPKVSVLAIMAPGFYLEMNDKQCEKGWVL